VPNEFGILCDNILSKRPDFLVFNQRTRVIGIGRSHARFNQVVDYDCSIKFVCDCVSDFYAFCAESPVTFQVVLSPLLSKRPSSFARATVSALFPASQHSCWISTIFSVSPGGASSRSICSSDTYLAIRFAIRAAALAF